MAEAGFDWDILISYSSDDFEWVWESLYLPLTRCRMRDGAAPRIFLDKKSIRIGENYQAALEHAFPKSRNLILVYSATYFGKKWVEWEVSLAVERDPGGTRGVLVPILLDPAAQAMILHRLHFYQFLDVRLPDWFTLLCAHLELTPAETSHELRFLDQPADVVVRHTLPPLRVAVTAAGKTLAVETEVVLASEPPGVQGSLRRRTENGVARFDDLSFGQESAAARLVASADGCLSATSAPFAVAAPAGRAEVLEAARIPLQGEAVFFRDGSALAVLGERHVEVYDASTKLAGKTDLPGPLRFARAVGSLLVLATWSGDVVLLRQDGSAWRPTLARPATGFHIPADGCVPGDTDESLLAGFWNGDLYRLQWGETEPAKLAHPAGIQALAVCQGRLYVCGMDGSLCVYEGERIVRTDRLEQTVWLLKAFGDCLVAVGDRNLHHISPARPVILQEPLPLGNVRAALGETDRPVVVDEEGRGVVLDAELRMKPFHVAAGAAPASADQAARYCVFRHPDGTRSLMVEGRVVYTQPAGALAVALAGDRFAVGDAGGIRIVAADKFLEAIRDGRRATA
jgi:hypothetical protein